MEKVSLLAEHPFYPSLRSKKLKGRFGHFESSVNMDIRIVWRYENRKIIILLDVGHHDILKKY
jgi:mRNA-degrading endonuclease YafQ of YafQ-DinJ toxin-antitoxin module